MTRHSALEVSVVIAAFNAEATLGEQLAALSRQRVSFPFEVLICDNGSSDSTASLAESWADRLPLRVIEASARRGPGAARNAGAAVAASPLLVFCDADDVVADNWLSEMHAALQTDVFVAGMCRLPYRHNRPGEPAEYFDYTLYRVPLFPQLLAAGAANIGVRTEVFRSVGGFDDVFRTAEDNDLCFRIQLAGHRLVAHPEAVIVLRNRSSLRATFAQAYGYRAGERFLKHKYAKVIEAFRDLEPAQIPSEWLGAAEESPGEESGARRSAASFIGRAFRKLLRIRHLSDLSSVTFKIGEAFGSRFSRGDPSQPQIEPPAAPEELLRRG
jgi:glycosyltransferase involved in cell wall biosynthesis